MRSQELDASPPLALASVLHASEPSAEDEELAHDESGVDAGPSRSCVALPKHAVAKATLALVMMQYIASIMACGFLVYTHRSDEEDDRGDSTEKPESENTMSTAVIVALLVVGFGFAILCLRTVVVIFILVQDKGSSRAFAAGRGWPRRRGLEMSRNVSLKLCFVGMCGAPIYFIEAMYLRNAWDHPQRFMWSILLTACAVIEVTLSLSGTLLFRAGSQRSSFSSVVTGDWWRPPSWERSDSEKIAAMPIEELVCHSCTPSRPVSDLDDIEMAQSESTAACQGCESKEWHDQQRQDAGAFHMNDDCEDVQCAICLMRFEDAEVLGRLPCRHVFHKTCIQTWLLRARTCPFRCRIDMLEKKPAAGERFVWTTTL